MAGDRDACEVIHGSTCCVRKECVRVGLAETLSTFVMMVSRFIRTLIMTTLESVDVMFCSFVCVLLSVIKH